MNQTADIVMIDLDERTNSLVETNSPIFVGEDSTEFADQITFLQTIKSEPIAKDCRICVTCWTLITTKDQIFHSKPTHTLTGNFHEMAHASK
jgi:hypothetical protein